MHVIYRLSGSIPVSLLHLIEEEYQVALADLRYRSGLSPTAEKTDKAFLLATSTLRRQYMQRIDDFLDRARSGPRFLKDPVAAKLIIDSWRQLEWLGEVIVFAISVMPNHVHAFIQHPDPEGNTDLKKLMHRHRSWTATQINLAQNQKGRKVWDKPIFDRDARDFNIVLNYILNNPVQAKLCEKVAFWPGNYWKAGYW